MDTFSPELHHWLSRLSQKPMPIWLSQTQIESAATQGNARLAQLIDHDPLLATRIFHHCRNAKDGATLKSINQAVESFGAGQIRTLSQDLPRLSPGKTTDQHLLQSIGDALLATSLLRAWFELKGIPWSDEDYWLSVMDASAIWAMWWLEPQIMEGFEYQLETKGKVLHKSISEHLNCRYLESITGLMSLWQLPIALNLGQAKAAEGQLLYKRQALKFFLRFAHELAQASRYDWQSISFQQLCRRGSIALGIQDFEQQLINWMSAASKQHPLMPWVGTALSQHQHGHQPNWLSTERYRMAQQHSNNHEVQSAKSQVLDDWPAHNDSRTNHPSVSVDKSFQAKDIAPDQPGDITATNKSEAAKPRAQISKAINSQENNLDISGTPLHQRIPPQAKPESRASKFQAKPLFYDVKQAMLRLHPPFSTQLDLEYSLIQAAQTGLELDSFILWRKANTDPWFELVSWRGNVELASRLPLKGSTILQQFAAQPVSLWINDQNRDKTQAQLPLSLKELTTNQHHFFRGVQSSMGAFLLHGISKTLGTDDQRQQYQLFRELASAFGKACEQIQKFG